MFITSRRDEELDRFFAAHTDRVRRAVTRHTHGVCDATIEDACQTAWAKLVRRIDVTLDERGLSWLVTVAIHEAHDLAKRERTEVLAGAFLPAASDAELPEPAADSRDVDEQVAGHIETGQRREDLRQIKPEDRRALYLKGMGYSYAEIMTLTGATYTAVNRRITEGRAELRRLARQRAHPGP
jgi:RNA polymerase sigma factor (sigma-70 family)